MKITLVISIIVCLIAYACGKSDGLKPSPYEPNSGTEKPKEGADTTIKGGLIGQVSPLPGSTMTIVASTVINGQTIEYRTSLRSDGTFMFLSLPVGTYTMGAAKGAEYMFPDVKAVRVISGSQTDVGTIAMIADPDNGKIIGTIKPAGAAGAVLVQCVEPLSGLRFEVKPDPGTGNFEFLNLPPGKWSVWFAANKGYDAPTGVVTTIINKQIVNAGTFEFKTTAPVSTLSMKARGKNMALEGSAAYDGSSLYLSGLHYNGSFESPSYRTYRLEINIPNLTGPGNYICNGLTGSKITYIIDGYRMINSNGYGKWSSQVAGSTGAIIVTRIDHTTKTITGTFTADLGPLTNSSKGFQNISEGTFTATYK